MYYLIPITSQSMFVAEKNTAVNAPKYLLSLNQPFGCTPFGVEGVGLVVTAQNATLDQASDVFAFPDLGQTLIDSDVSALASFCAPLNIPTSFVAAGMSWRSVIRRIAQVFLVAQAVSGANKGAPIFPSGVTADSTVADVAAASVQPSSPSSAPASAPASAPPASQASALVTAGFTAGPFDLTNISVSQSIGDALLSISQQFTNPIFVGAETWV